MQKQTLNTSRTGSWQKNFNVQMISEKKNLLFSCFISFTFFTHWMCRTEVRTTLCKPQACRVKSSLKGLFTYCTLEVHETVSSCWIRVTLSVFFPFVRYVRLYGATDRSNRALTVTGGPCSWVRDELVATAYPPRWIRGGGSAWPPYGN